MLSCLCVRLNSNRDYFDMAMHRGPMFKKRDGFLLVNFDRIWIPVLEPRRHPRHKVAWYARCANQAPVFSSHCVGLRTDGVCVTLMMIMTRISVSYLGLPSWCLSQLWTRAIWCWWSQLDCLRWAARKGKVRTMDHSAVHACLQCRTNDWKFRWTLIVFKFSFGWRLRCGVLFSHNLVGFSEAQVEAAKTGCKWEYRFKFGYTIRVRKYVALNSGPSMPRDFAHRSGYFNDVRKLAGPGKNVACLLLLELGHMFVSQCFTIKCLSQKSHSY